MMRIAFLILAGGLIAVNLCGQSMKTHTEKDVDLTMYETFTVLKGEFMVPPDSRKVNEEALFQSVKSAVVKEMEQRGYKFTEDSTAQLRVSYVAGTYDLSNVGVTGPLGQAPASNAVDMNQSRAWTTTSREGMLVIDITDSANKKLLWKAEGNDLSIDTVDITHALDAVIYKAFRKFPNKLKKKKK